MIQPLQSTKLTKRFLFSLQEGLYLASGVGESPTQPAFAEIVTPLSQRQEQWERIVTACANGRQCDVFKDQHDFLTFALSVRYNYEKN